MKPLIDADILLHEIGWSGEFKDKETGEEVMFGFDRVAEILDDKIRGICWDVEADEPPRLFITNSEDITKWDNKWRRWRGEPEQPYIHNFRYAVAKTKPYKGTRHNPKPWHFHNLVNYMRSEYDTVVSVDGLEADDMMCMEQFGRDDTIICSRDKDLRICPGNHFSWECGKQYAIGPVQTDRLGWLEKAGKKTIGYGLSFFYYQMLVGDSADNIPGLKGWGEARATTLLMNCSSEEELFKTVKQAYKDLMGPEAKEYFMEQANLLWMIQEKGRGYEIPR